MKQNKIVIPYSAVDGDGVTPESTEQTLTGLLGQMDANTGAIPPAETTPPTPPEVTETETTPGSTQQTPPPANNNPSNTAFAEMRVKNNMYTQLLGKLAASVGIEYSNEQELINKLNDNALADLAKRQNISPELMQRLDLLEQNNMLYQQDQRRQAALAGFQTLKDTYALDDQQLQAFAAELDKQGQNPFVQDVNLMDVYKLTHFNDIIAAEVNKAVQAALTKSNMADEHSSTPGSAQGVGGTAPTTSTVAGLREVLSTLQ